MRKNDFSRLFMFTFIVIPTKAGTYSGMIPDPANEGTTIIEVENGQLKIERIENKTITYFQFSIIYTSGLIISFAEVCHNK